MFKAIKKALILLILLMPTYVYSENAAVELFVQQIISENEELHEKVKKLIDEDKEIKEFYEKNYGDDYVRKCVIVKFECDLDNNGEKDMLISSRNCDVGNHPSWGNAGGNWKPYFSIDGKYIDGKVIFFHPYAVKFESTGQEKEFYYSRYWRSNCCTGTIEKSLVTLSEETLISSEFIEETNIDGSPGNKKIYEALSYNSEFRPSSPAQCNVAQILEKNANGITTRGVAAIRFAQTFYPLFHVI